MAAGDLFSITAMFILFREALEAAVVISVMLQLCSKMKMQNLQRWVWAGACLGIGCAIVVGTVFIVLFYVAKKTIFRGAGQAIFSGFLELIASFMLTFLAFAMLKVKGYEEKWRLKLEAAAVKGASKHTQGWWQIALLAWTTTFREGLESFIFLTGVSAGIDPKSIPIAGLVGIVLGVAVGLVLFYTGKSIADIGWFIIAMCVLLFFIAAGLTARGFTSLQSAGWFGYYGYPAAAQPWQNQVLWDWSRCCSSDVTQNRFFGLIGALFGYTAQGTAIWLFAYFGYWLEVLLVVAARAMKGSLLTAMKVQRPQSMQLPLSKIEPTSSSSSDDQLKADLPMKAPAGSGLEAMPREPANPKNP